MKVKELIAKLETMDQNKEVAIINTELGWAILSKESVYELHHIPVWDESLVQIHDNASVVALG